MQSFTECPVKSYVAYETKTCKIIAHFDKVSSARRGLKYNPLIHSDGLLVLVPLDGNVPSEEQQWKWRHLGTVVEEDL